MDPPVLRGQRRRLRGPAEPRGRVPAPGARPVRREHRARHAAARGTALSAGARRVIRALVVVLVLALTATGAVWWLWADDGGVTIDAIGDQNQTVARGQRSHRREVPQVRDPDAHTAVVSSAP